jgi:hypothetical protein
VRLRCFDKSKYKSNTRNKYGFVYIVENKVIRSEILRDEYGSLLEWYGVLRWKYGSILQRCGSCNPRVRYLRPWYGKNTLEIRGLFVNRELARVGCKSCGSR